MGMVFKRTGTVCVARKSFQALRTALGILVLVEQTRPLVLLFMNAMTIPWGVALVGRVEAGAAGHELAICSDTRPPAEGGNAHNNAGNIRHLIHEMEH